MSERIIGYGKYKTKGGKPEQRYIVEDVLCQRLAHNEVVHHINGDKSDNRIENLQVVTHSQHRHIHNGTTPRDPVLRCIDCPVCGKTIQDARKDQKYCSSKCRSSAWTAEHVKVFVSPDGKMKTTVVVK